MDKKEQEEHHTDASRYLLIDNIKDAYDVPYLYQDFRKIADYQYMLDWRRKFGKSFVIIPIGLLLKAKG